jgi:hypothetical protein
VWDRKPAGWDAALYAVGAAVAGIATLADRIPLQRDWGRIALVPYVVGALAALALSRAGAQAPSRARVALAVCVLVGVAFLPMTLEIWWRARDGYVGHVQSETLVTEESAGALLAGHDPYAESFASGPLGTWPAGTADHVPYLPGMFAFGVPRVVVDDALIADARLAFAVASLAAIGFAVWLAGPRPERGLTALLIVLALPTGARYMAGGGDDVTVLSMMLLSLAFLHRKRPTPAGLAAGMAAAIKQTAWPLLPFLILAARDREGRRASGRTLVAASAVMLPLIAPFFVWNPRAFVQDVVLFPLGLTRQPTLAASPTPGSLLADTLSLSKGVVAGALLLIVLLVGAYLAFLRPPTDARGAAERTALVMLLAILLATAGRFGYLLYPIGLFAWGRLVLMREPPEAVAMNADTRTLRWRSTREGARAAKGSGL